MVMSMFFGRCSRLVTNSTTILRPAMAMATIVPRTITAMPAPKLLRPAAAAAAAAAGVGLAIAAAPAQAFSKPNTKEQTYSKIPRHRCFFLLGADS